MRTASSENQRKNSEAYAISALVSLIGLPISRVISRASSSARSVMISYAVRRISPRSRGGVAAQSACAATAASSAALPSATLASATSTRVWPCRRVLDRERLAALGIAPLTTDEQLRVDGGDDFLLAASVMPPAYDRDPACAQARERISRTRMKTNPMMTTSTAPITSFWNRSAYGSTASQFSPSR